MARTATAAAVAEPTGHTYLMRGIDPAMWREFNIAAMRANTDMKTLLLQFVAAYVDGSITFEDGAAKCRRKGGAK